MIGVSILAFHCIFIHTTISDETAKTRFTSLRDSYVKKKREMLKKSKSGRGTDPSAELSPVKSYKCGNYILQNARNTRNVQNNNCPLLRCGGKLQKQINASSINERYTSYIYLIGFIDFAYNLGLLGSNQASVLC